MPQLTDAQKHVAIMLGRIIVALPLIENGLRKIASFGMTAAMMGGAPPTMIDGRLFPIQTPLVYFPLPEFFLASSVVFDLVGALLLLVGFMTRPIALFLTGYVILAATIFHGDIRGPQDVMQLLRILPTIGGLILIATIGAGRWSLDGRLRRHG